MKKEVDYKVSGGKMIRVRAEIEKNLLKEIKITGDFFMHPEEKIEAMESSLRGKELEKEELEEAIEKIIKEESIQLLGISKKDFVSALMKLKA